MNVRDSIFIKRYCFISKTVVPDLSFTSSANILVLVFFCIPRDTEHFECFYALSVHRIKYSIVERNLLLYPKIPLVICSLLKAFLLIIKPILFIHIFPYISILSRNSRNYILTGLKNRYLYLKFHVSNSRLYYWEKK